MLLKISLLALLNRPGPVGIGGDIGYSNNLIFSLLSLLSCLLKSNIQLSKNSRSYADLLLEISLIFHQINKKFVEKLFSPRKSFLFGFSLKACLHLFNGRIAS